MLNSNPGLKEHKSIIGLIVILAVFGTNISQLPYFVEKGITQNLSYPIWIAMFAFSIIHMLTHGKIRINRQVITFFYLLFAICVLQVIFSLFTDNNYFGSSMFTYMLFSLAILFLGNVIGDEIKSTEIDGIFTSFILSSFAVEINIYLSYFTSVNAFAQKSFVYASKNSISTLLVVGVLMCILKMKEYNRTQKILGLLYIISTTYIMLLLKSRASILGLLLSMIIIMFSKLTNKKIKRWLWVALIAVILFLVFNEKFYNIIINNVFFANNDVKDLNALSSGRVVLLKNYGSLISNHWFGGIGAIYFECAPLSAILQFGFIVGSLYILIMFCPLFYTYRYRKQSDTLFAIYLIAVVFSVNALFEGLPPFGPGAKCFILWLLLGIVFRQVQPEDQIGRRNYIGEEHYS